MIIGRKPQFLIFKMPWAIADRRLCDRPGWPLWASFSEKQVYLASLLTKPLGEGPALSVSAYPPDLDYFCNRGAKDILPLYRDAKGQEPNLTEGLLETLAQAYGFTPTPEDFAAYVYALLAHPGYTERFREELRLGGPRVPLTRDPELFREAVEVGKHLLWLHTYGERSGDRKAFQDLEGRAYWGKSPTRYPEHYSYNRTERILHVGDGEVAEVAPEVWDFRIDRFHPLRNWLDRRKQQPGGRKSSPLDEIQPKEWTADLSRELLELIWVLEGTVKSYRQQKELLERVLAGPTFTVDALPQPQPHERETPGGEDPEEGNRSRERAGQGELFSDGVGEL